MIDKKLMAKAKDVKGLLLAVGGLSLIGGMLAVLQAFFLAKIINGLFLDGIGVMEILDIIIFMILVISIRPILSILRTFLAQKSASKIKTNVRENLINRAFSYGPVGIKSISTGTIINMVNQGVEALDEYFSGYIPQLLTVAVLPASILFVTFGFDKYTFLLFLLTAPVIPIMMILIGNLADKHSKKQWGILSKMNAHFYEALSGISVLKMFSLGKRQADIIFKTSETFRKSTMKVLRVSFLSALVLEFFSTVGTALVAVSFGIRIINGTADYEIALFLLFLAPEFYLPFRQLGMKFHASVSGVTAFSQISEFLEVKEEEGIKKGDCIENKKIDKIESIEYKNVSYKYKSRNDTALKDISFSLKKGERLTLAGESGVGKTTIANLLLKYIEKLNGRILVNDIDIENIENLPDHISYVPQNPYIFYGTIKENLLMGNDVGNKDDSKWILDDLVESVGLKDFIEKLPNGLDTHVGEGGLGLSGGQIQKIAIARALLRDSEILILDEPTSNMDTVSDKKIQKIFDDFAKEKLVIYITHRQSNINESENLLYIEKHGLVKQYT